MAAKENRVAWYLARILAAESGATFPSEYDSDTRWLGMAHSVVAGLAPHEVSNIDSSYELDSDDELAWANRNKERARRSSRYGVYEDWKGDTNRRVINGND